jgi:hypothetical protein
MPPPPTLTDAATESIFHLMKHLHLDAFGGIAGDMFIAALLNAYPALAPGAIAAAEALGGVRCRLLAHHDGVLAGARFQVDEVAGHAPHAHTAWHDIRARIAAASALAEPVRLHAIGIFTHLAEAEARVHGIAAEAVAFHEVGAADSIADILGAAWLIDALGPAHWSVSPLPQGGGQVRTAHGPLPVPAPATVLLLEGFDMVDDGIAGERVTPTGAAILRHLDCVRRGAAPGRLVGSGLGFGTRRLEGISNALRVLAFEASEPVPPEHDVTVIAFEVDDQSAEDLAAGLDRLRAASGVLDVLQMAAFGKKGRVATHVQVLAEPAAAEAVAEMCFRETTTIGLRLAPVRRLVLARRRREVMVGERRVGVKLVERPGGRTGKVEADDLAALSGQAARARLRREAEAKADDDDDA